MLAEGTKKDFWELEYHSFSVHSPHTEDVGPIETHEGTCSTSMRGPGSHVGLSRGSLENEMDVFRVCTDKAAGC